MPSPRQQSGRLNALTRHRGASDPAVLEARRDLAAVTLEEHIRRIVDTFPPLSAEQRSRLAVLLLATPAPVELVSA